VKSIVYLSEAKVEFSEDDLSDLVTLASSKNRLCGITGYLCFSRGRFIQYLEGSSNAVNEMMESIRRDPRHELIYETEIPEIRHRVFDTWWMRHITKDELNAFQLEHCIEQNLLYIKSNFFFKDKCREYIRENIRTISSIYRAQKKGFL